VAGFPAQKNDGSMGVGEPSLEDSKASSKTCLQTVVVHHLKVRRRMLKKIKVASSIRKNSMIASEMWTVSRVNMLPMRP